MHAVRRAPPPSVYIVGRRGDDIRRHFAEKRPGGRSEKTMSVAFTREESAETATEVNLPDRPLSPHNFVTPSGLKALETAMAEARSAYNAAQQIDDVSERRRASAAAARDMKYFAERLQTAQLVVSTSGDGIVAFGNSVTFRRRDGRRQVFRIVGEDEADPRSGSISYVSPVARVLLGKGVGDIVGLGDDELEVLSVAQ
jgi:transcription elongation GreA/GreB family factor